MGRLLGLLSLLVAVAASAQDRAALSDFELSLDGQRVSASFRLENGFDEGLKERIRSGLPSGFLFRFRLYRDHKKWFDNRMDSNTLEVVGVYNAVTREYLVNYKQDGKLIESRIVLELDELEQAMTEFENLPIFTLGELPLDWRLLVRARVEFGTRRLLLFVPMTVSTEQIESRKFHPPGGPE